MMMQKHISLNSTWPNLHANPQIDVLCTYVRVVFFRLDTSLFLK